MDQNNVSVSCSVIIEWINSQGSILKKVNHRSATLYLIRNDHREMFIEVHAEKAKTKTKLLVKSMSVFNKFMTEGKASIKFKDENCTLFLSNAPTAQLINFLKTVYIKISSQSDEEMKNPLKKKFLNTTLDAHHQEISPVTSIEINKAKQNAISVSRATITTPSPSAVKKRKQSDQSTSKSCIVKKLYETPKKEQITDEQNKILNAVLSGKNVFFTGSAGTGKSFLLRTIIAALPPDVTVATASTGVAACHIGGQTLHQFSGIGLGTANLERCVQMASRNSSAASWRKTKHLIIDEISMVDGDYFDKIEAVARHIRKSERPFGGIQLILCGDFFQLPPVSTKDKNTKFCFQSEAWEKCVHFNFELQTVHRQKDPEFVKILNSIRIGRVTDDIAERLKATAKQKIENNGILATRLCSHVNEAEEINEHQLNSLEGESKIYIAQDSDVSMTNTLNQQLTVPDKLILKVGAQVMLLKNVNISDGLVNGARGVVTKFVDNVPIVQFRSGLQYRAKLEKWNLKTNLGTVVHRKQIPLKLAWAFSIHKSQGLTLDCIEMSLARVFNAGQAYVALSRAQSLQSLRVLDFHSQQVWAHTDVLMFYKKFRRNLQEMEMIPLGKKQRI
ncbi:ATP-dependent DNA helicase PIF1 [Eufriesea mexicana]|uniref:ATP-dependent DNA helicase PIF1 n=1 Tax=Eufriesea mexicana TaxID=516756 RepID=UPI00083C38E9|nr:PREDICTED: ATP-dependent DNA helicase PIF1 [Eufriesea mexicana]OAD60941.1 ATP-dependent DNA helicase PIF1 [Eufriesea mexicana]